MTESLLESYGIYGGSLVVAFIAGIFPLASIEVFLIGIAVAVTPSFGEMTLCCLLAAAGHQVAKTITYYTGAGAMTRGKLGAKIEQLRPRIDRWNKAPHLILCLASTFGIPPLYILSFIARPLMGIKFLPYTAIIFGTRIVRFVVLAGIPLLF